MVNFSELRKFSNDEIKSLLAEVGIKPTKYYLRNINLVHSQLTNYVGPLNLRAIKNYLVTKDENDINLVRPGIYKDKNKDEHEFIKNLMNMKVPESRTQKSHDERTNKYKEAIKQLVEARKVIRSKQKQGKKFTFDFSVLNKDEKEYFNKHVGKVIIEFVKSIKFTEKWICRYDFHTFSREKPLNSNNIGSLLHQLKNNGFISNAEADAANIVETNYDYFLYGLENLTRITFEEISSQEEEEEENPLHDANLEFLIQMNAPKEMIEARKKELQAMNKNKKKKHYKTRDGQFWKYTCDLPINLERYQIFRTVNKYTASKMTEDNCLVYACIQAGVDENIINHIREIVRTRAFPQSKLQKIVDETGLEFVVRIVYLQSESSERSTKNLYQTYTPSNKNPIQSLKLVLLDGHYLLDEDIPVSTFFIKNYENIIKTCSSKPIDYLQKINRFSEGKYKIKNDLKTNIVKIILTLFQTNHFKPITYGDINVYSTNLYKEKLQDFSDLDYSKKFCTKLKAPAKEEPKKKTEYNTIIYADFECSTDGVHKAFNICFESADGKLKNSFWGEDCARQFLDVVPDKSLIYYHNLSYDINFVINCLTDFKGTPIIKGSRTMMIAGIYKKKNICFKDSYTIISKPLKLFPSMFKLATGPKEVFPYTYYSSTVLKDSNKVGIISEALKHVSDKDTFIKNINTIKGCKLGKDTFDMEVYSTYYCSQDVRILKEGFERFRKDLYSEFKLDAYDFVSICSIANKYFENEVYFKNGNLYDLAGKPREFISRCVQGGRCMLADNKKQINDNGDEIVDFDAVSLYPSAYARLYTVEGIPKVIPQDLLDADILLAHLFEENQQKPTKERYISAFYVEIRITDIGKERHMPLIVVDKEFNPELKDIERSSNTCCTMYVDHITLQDLIEFQKIKCEVIRGYYYDGKRDTKIRDVVENLFKLRLKYKKEDNPLQEVIKLILNSIYGRTILKPIEDKTVFVQNSKASAYSRKNYNSIIEINNLYNSDFTIFKQIKPIVRHFNFCPLGVTILSMSKRIMNEVFCTAEDFDIKINYQDTDSAHLKKKDLPILAKLYKAKYNRELIGKNLGQFHSDFAEIDKGHESSAIKSIFCGKKTYIDMLSNDLGSIAFHVRMKGVKQDVIAITANELFPKSVPCEYDSSSGIFRPVGECTKDSQFSLMNLYKYLYDGHAVSFDLCKGVNPCFDRQNNFTIVTKQTFIRELKF